MVTKLQVAIEWYTDEIVQGFRHRSPFSGCRGTRARSKASALMGTRWEREKLRMKCAALRALRLQAKG